MGFDSDTPSDDSSDAEEVKGGHGRSVPVSGGNSFEDSQGELRTVKTKANTTANESVNTTIESANFRALQESLDNLSQQKQKRGNKARQEVLQLAEKVLAEKTAMADQLDHLRDKQRALRSKLASSEDKAERLKSQAAESAARYEKQQAFIKRQAFENEEMKLAIEEYTKDVKNLSTENKRL